MKNTSFWLLMDRICEIIPDTDEQVVFIESEQYAAAHYATERGIPFQIKKRKNGLYKTVVEIQKTV